MRHPLLRHASIALAALALACPHLTAQLKLTPDHAVALRGGEGSTTFLLTNQGPAAVDLDLKAASVVDDATGAVLSKARTSLINSSGPADAPLPKSLAANETISLQANLSVVTTTSAAHVEIFNAGKSLGKLHMLEIDAPLNLSIEGAGSPDKPLPYPYGDPVPLALKNGDPQPYHIKWVSQLDGKTQASGDFYIPANGEVRIPLKSECPTTQKLADSSTYCQGYSLFDRIHPSSKESLLLLSLVEPPDVPSNQIDPALLPARTLPVNLLMRRVEPTTSNSMSYAYAGLLLFLGGILSIVASSVLPNMQKKVNLRSQLKHLADRTTSVSTRIDSYLRVLLRLERKRIDISIEEISVWLPAAADPLLQVATAIAVLDKRLTAAERLDDLRRKHEQISETAPPSVTDEIDRKLQAAADQLHSLNLSDDDLAATSALLGKAQTSLALLDDFDTLAKIIAANLTSLKTRLARFPTEYCLDLKDALAGVWVIIDPARGFDDPKNIVPPMLFAIDHGVAAIHLALDYAMVRASVPIPDVKTGIDPGQTVRARLLKRHGLLTELLGTLSWRALREASNIVAQMREDIYEDDILEECARPGQAAISFDTQKPRPYLPVFFSIAFKDNRFNGAAALQRMVYEWAFPESLNEHGWKVCHYFSGEEERAATPATAPPAPAVPREPPPPDDWKTEVGKAVRSYRKKVWKHFKRHLGIPTLPRDIDIYVVVHGRKTESRGHVTNAPLLTTIQIQRVVPREHSRFLAEFLRFAIAFCVALAGLLSGALGQLDKLDFIPATIAIIALGFGADSIKNLLTQAPAQPPALPSRKT